MRSFIFLISLTLLYFVAPSSDVQQHLNDHDVMKAYHRYLNKPNKQTLDNFANFTTRFYNQSFLECLKLLERYRTDWIFRVVFWQALEGRSTYIDPRKVTASLRSISLIWITHNIREIFLNCSFSDESKFKTEMEAISLLIKMAELTSSEVNVLGIGSLVNNLGDRIAIWKFLIRNISINFTKGEIDYVSLIRTFSEIRLIIKTKPPFINDSQHLAKLCALFVFYLDHIYSTNCTSIFDLSHNLKAEIIFLVVKSYRWSYNFDTNGEFNSNRMIIYLTRFYKANQGQLYFTLKMLRGYRYYPKFYLLDFPKGISTFTELARIPDDCLQKDHNKAWQIRALAELEFFLSRNGQRAPYSVNIDFNLKPSCTMKV